MSRGLFKISRVIGSAKSQIKIQPVLELMGPTKSRIDSVGFAFAIDRTSDKRSRRGKKFQKPILGIKQPDIIENNFAIEIPTIGFFIIFARIMTPNAPYEF